MRATTMFQPMAQALASGEKTVENRPRRPPHSLIGEVFAIHAGLTWDEGHARQVEALTGIRQDPALAVHGAIIGVVRLVRVIAAKAQLDLGLEGLGSDPAFTNPWFTGPFGLVCHGAVALREPIPCRGMQGYWNLPPDVEAKITAQLEGRAA